MSLLSHHPYQKVILERELEELQKRTEDLHPISNENGGKKMGSNEQMQVGCAVIAVIGVILLIPVLMWGLPLYNVWKSELQGKAELVRAEQNRQIKIEEAKANLEAEKLNAEAEVERAKGAAKAIEIENGKLTDTYIKYLAVRTFNTDNAKFVYIPTECGIVPYLMEAGRGPKVGFPNNGVK